MLALAEQDGVHLPFRDVTALKKAVRAGEVRESLEDYLTAFALTTSVMQTARAIERVAYELVLDCAQENVIRLEARFSPVLHRTRGLSLEAVTEAALAGLQRGAADTGISVGLILCGIRNLSPDSSLAIAKVGVALRERGVCGFDLAGPEMGYPASLHKDAFVAARAGGLSITVHAGEAEGAWSVAEALDQLAASRVGHGTHLVDDAALIERVRAAQLGVEVCLQSNLETQSVPSLAAHPFAVFVRTGLCATLNTDNRLMSNIDLSGEYMRAAQVFALTDAELARVCRNGFAAAFVDASTRAALLLRVEAMLAHLS
jgi:adenosine deaminase